MNDLQPLIGPDSLLEKELCALRQRFDEEVNEMHSIDDVPLSPTQQKYVMEYLARCLDRVIEGVTGDSRCSKTYDPLIIRDNVAHSYAFDLWDGGRHHPFTSLKQLEDGLINETVKICDLAIPDKLDRR